MMRPMKLAGSELMFGEGSLAYIKTIKAKKVSIVIGGHSMENSGMLAKVEGYFKETGAETMVIRGVEPDPSFETVLRGRNEMLEFEPDLIVGLGGGSAMDAAKAMWIFYEHPELTQMEDILPPNEFPKLRGKARMCCIPSTSGTASEVSRSIVISDNEKGLKHGVGNMEMMPDMIAISESTPGPLGINMATYAGYHAYGVLGAIVATVGLVLPSLIIIIIIANFLKKFQSNPLVQDGFAGLRPIVTALIAAACWQVMKITLFCFDTFQETGNYLDIFNWKTLFFFVLIYVLLRKYKKHPVVYIAGAAAAGIIFQM